MVLHDDETFLVLIFEYTTKLLTVTSLVQSTSFSVWKYHLRLLLDLMSKS